MNKYKVHNCVCACVCVCLQIFGPLLPIVVDDLDGAIQFINARSV